jgi:DnaJ-class molecular chaperone
MKCPRCNGAKKISDLGFVKRQCPECLGVGHVKDEPVLMAEEIEIVHPEVITHEKKTRNRLKLTQTIHELGA